ncbi:MAG: HAD-IIA family hydrolase [Chloroflexota bacterium]
MMLLPETTKGLILDMDGVLWSDTAQIGNLANIFSKMKDLGIKPVMATNNSTRTVEQYVNRLAGFGVKVEPWQIITSSQAAAELMSKNLEAGSEIFAIGEEGLQEEVKKKGFVLLTIEQAARATAVVIGLDRKINFEKMVEAALLIRSGKPFFATNRDKTFPTPRGQIPGAGAWSSVLITATDKQPLYAGKPFTPMMEIALERLGTKKENTFVVGDRLETDIAGGQKVGCPTALVLSGVCSRDEAIRWSPKIQIIAEDLSSLLGM